jgi:hypothetical protein
MASTSGWRAIRFGSSRRFDGAAFAEQQPSRKGIDRKRAMTLIA